MNPLTNEQISKLAEERYPLHPTACRVERQIINHLRRKFIEKKRQEQQNILNTITP